MNVALITPAAAHSHLGNRITALRCARILRGLGHRVEVAQEYSGRRCEVLVALHARKSFRSIERFRRQHPERPLVLMLTGTDLYGDIQTDAQAQQSLEMASRLVVLQPQALVELREHLRPKTRIIYQSAQRPLVFPPPKKNIFEVCVMGHLRPVKDPFRTAEAVRLLPASSRIQVVHIGAALSHEMEESARAQALANPRYHWLGELPHGKALRIMARSRLMVLSSQLEGGANVLSEAIAAAVPVLASRISGSIGILGRDYPGYFPVGDSQALAAMLHRAETHATFLETLGSRCRQLQPLFEPARERQHWQDLLEELCAANSVPGRTP
ncbi:MAG: selenoneine biosynthesis selenosugar synthase SenB [Acidobacteriota bacterium]